MTTYPTGDAIPPKRILPILIQSLSLRVKDWVTTHRNIWYETEHLVDHSASVQTSHCAIVDVFEHGFLGQIQILQFSPSSTRYKLRRTDSYFNCLTYSISVSFLSSLRETLPTFPRHIGDIYLTMSSILHPPSSILLCLLNGGEATRM